MSRVILEDIINHFEPGKFTRFFREKNNRFAPREESYGEYDEENFVNGRKLGEISFEETEQVVVVTFEAKQPLSERSGKRAQYEKGKRILKEKQYDAGIFIFYDTQGNFRFSLIYANYLGRRRDWSTFRRFTYFVSSNPESTNKTFKQRIGDADFSTLEKIKDAFSVEKVTQSFYTDIANWYFWAVQCSTFPKGAEDEENGRNIAIIRLVTRLIFIWFMKERGLVPALLFNKSEIINLLNNLDSKETTYYKAILQNLFFATLNTKNKDRKYRFQNPDYWVNKDYMIHSIYRYESYFKDKNIMLEIFKDIPFLNGGLFDCLDRASKDNNDQGEVRIDGFSDKDVGLKVPNLLFFSEIVEADLNKEYGTSNKKYHVRGLLDILQSYNFTIDENDPNDQEVALDPELLGKVFENLLASFNPETASTARKATGSYYTPREIVDYMVSESLKNYFKTSLEIEGIDDKLATLFSVENGENPFDAFQTLKLVQLINDLRVVDPAVGSGAFPMGILNKLVFILGKLDPDNTLWKNAQIKAIETGVTDPMIKKQLTDQVEDRFTNKNLDYGRKLYLIQKCIYGVDIQQIAVEIAKLRFFISLLVDEKIDKTKENWGVEPLPNLDYKIMQGNSLLEEYEGIKLFDERLLNLTLPDESELKGIEEKINEKERELMPFYIKEPKWMKNPKLERPQELVVIESEINRLKLAQKDLIKFYQAKMANGNQERMQFQAEDGQSQEVWLQLQDLHKKLFTPTLTRDDKREIKKEIDELEWRLIEATLREQNKIKELENIERMENSNTKPFFLWRLYFPEVFEEKGGFDIAIANPPYIRSRNINKADRAEFSKKYRSAFRTFDIYLFFIEKSLEILRPVGGLSFIIPYPFLTQPYASKMRKIVLEENTINEIADLSATKIFESAEVKNCLIFLKKGKTVENLLNVSKITQMSIIRNMSLSQNTFLENPEYMFKLEYFGSTKVLGQKLEKDSIRLGEIMYISKGIEVYQRGSGKTKKEFIYSTDNGLYKPYLEAKDISKYRLDWSEKYIDYQPSKHCSPKFPELFENKKILVKRIIGDRGLSSVIDTDNFYVENTLICCLPKHELSKVFTFSEEEINLSKTFNISLILSILNSKLINFYFKKKLGDKLQIYNSALESLPIKKISEEDQKLYIELVDKIHSLLKVKENLGNLDILNKVKVYEDQIDHMVYELYGLSREEVEMIEQNEK